MTFPANRHLFVRITMLRLSGLKFWIRPMTLASLPQHVHDNYEIAEWKHASAILQTDFPTEWGDIIAALTEFRLLRSHIAVPGGSKSLVADSLDRCFSLRGWREKSFDTKVLVDNAELSSPTHKIDCYKNRVAVEIEWNNKDPFFDRDLNNFRLLFELRAISVGVIITRSDGLQQIFNRLGRGGSYGQSTTHWGKLLPRLQGGGGGGCPVIAFAITEKLYVED